MCVSMYVCVHIHVLRRIQRERERQDETALYIFMHVLLLRHGIVFNTHRGGRTTRLMKQFHEIRLAIESSGSMLGRPGAGPKMYLKSD